MILGDLDIQKQSIEIVFNELQVIGISQRDITSGNEDFVLRTEFTYRVWNFERGPW